MSNLLVESVNGGVQEAFINEKRIEMEARALGVTIQKFLKQTSQWLNVVHTFDSALKVSLHLHFICMADGCFCDKLPSTSIRRKFYFVAVLQNLISTITLSSLKGILNRCYLIVLLPTVDYEM